MIHFSSWVFVIQRSHCRTKEIPPRLSWNLEYSKSNFPLYFFNKSFGFSGLASSPIYTLKCILVWIDKDANVASKKKCLCHCLRENEDKTFPVFIKWKSISFHKCAILRFHLPVHCTGRKVKIQSMRQRASSFVLALYSNIITLAHSGFLYPHEWLRDWCSGRPCWVLSLFIICASSACRWPLN